ncbi:tenascin-R-like [Diadema antillarum]|uniref:tenascin-R-like n=1 Tax=Diadema antillarum TaxID=105358 RepID=UPI003A86EE72
MPWASLDIGEANTATFGDQKHPASSGDFRFDRTIRDVPDPPSDVRVAMVGLTTLDLTWDFPSGSQTDEFYIEVIPPPKPGNLPIAVPADVNAFTVRGLSPGTVYQITVKSVSGDVNNCQTTNAADVVSTATEFLRPLEVVATNTRDTSTEVEFTQSSDAGVSLYRIQVTPAGGGNVFEQVVAPGTQASPVTGLRGGTNYILELTAIPQSDVTNSSFTTLPSPPGLSMVSTDFFSFTVALEPPANSSYDGFVVTANGESQMVLANEPVEVTFENLAPGVEYVVDAYSFFQELTSQPLSSTTINVLTESPLPGELIVTFYSTTTITVTWGTFPGSVEYTVTIDPSQGVMTNETLDNRRVTFYQLTPGRLYEITLNSTVDGETRINSTDQRTRPVPPSMLSVVPLTPVDTVSLFLSWTSPSEGEWDAISIMYTSEDGESDSVMLGKDETSYSLEGLFQATAYTIVVSSVSGQGDTREKSDPLTESATTGRLGPNTMIIADVNASSVFATWTISDDAAEYSYRLDDFLDRQIRQGSVPNAWLLLDDLSPATWYTLTTFPTGTMMDISQTFRTVPSPAGPINVVEEESGATTITLSWEPSSTAEFYRVSIKSPDGTTVNEYEVPSTNPLRVTFDNLMPDTRYTLMVESGLEALLPELEDQIGQAVTAE